MIAIDVEAGGVTCAACAAQTRGAVRVQEDTLRALRRLRAMSWADAMALALGATEDHVREIVDRHVTRLAGQPVRAARFLREIGRPWLASAGGRRLASTSQRGGESSL